jgi:hypothetical protein
MLMNLIIVHVHEYIRIFCKTYQKKDKNYAHMV